MQVVEKTLAAKLRSLVAPLPAGQDPDGLLRAAGHEALRAQLDGARPALEFYMEAAFDGLELSIEQRAEAARELSPLLMALPAGLERDLYSARLAERVGVSVEQLWKHLRARPRRRKPASDNRAGGAQEPMAPPAAAPTRQELDLLRELLLFPSLRPRLADLSEYASDPMRALLDELATSEQPLDEVLGHHVPDPRLAARLAGVDPARGDTEEETNERAERTLADVMNRLKVRHMRASLTVLRQELQDLEARGEPTEEVARRIQSLTRREKELKRPGSMV
jgi:DNA primase